MKHQRPGFNLTWQLKKNRLTLTGSLEELKEAKKKTETKFRGAIKTGTNVSAIITDTAGKNLESLSPKMIEEAKDFIYEH